jgi:hypothetical protein
MKRMTCMAVTSIVAAAGISVPPATAATPRVQLSGLGSYATPTDGTAEYRAEIFGRPVSGPSTGRVDLSSSSFPAPGECTPATATVVVVDRKGKNIGLRATGDVCGSLLPLGVIERFLGRYVVTSATQRGLVGDVGHLDLRLLNGEVSIYAVQS